MEYTDILYEERGPITVITFNRPAVHNCIRLRTHEELVDAWSRFKLNSGASVAVLTGAGTKAFSSGADLKAFAEILPGSPAEVKAHNDGLRPGILGPTRTTDIYKPIIAAVNGVAYAGGFEWACFADIRIAEEHAKFGVTSRRWNIGLGDGGTQRLPRIIGFGRAIELIISGRVVDATEAYRIGLVNEVVAKGTSLQKALQLAEYICALPQEALRADKEATCRGFGEGLQNGLRIEAECFNRLIGSPRLQEGLRQFIQRDHPDRRDNEPGFTPGLKG